MKLSNKKSTFKKLLITAGATTALLIGTSAMVHAGHHKGGMDGDHNRRGQMQAVMFEKLGVSESQQAQIKTIHDSKKEQMQALRASSKALRDQKQALDPASNDYVAQVRDISAQQADLQQQRAVLKAQMKHETSLVLTPEQRDAAKALKAERKAKRMDRYEKRKDRRTYKKDNLQNDTDD